MSAALMFSRHLHVMSAAPGRVVGGTLTAEQADGAGGGPTDPAAAAAVQAHPAIPLEAGEFVARYGSVVEFSPWVAEAAFDDGPFRDAAALHAAFERALFAAPVEAQLTVLRAHPELATKKRTAAAELTAESASEQAGAGLDQLDEDRRLALAAALAEYRERFDFPFIACVRDHGGATLDQLVASRLPAEPGVELQVALGEVSRIARHRLVDLVDAVDVP